MYPNTALSGLSGNPQMMVLYNLSSLFLAGDEKKGKTFVMDSISDEGDQPWQSYHTVFTNAKAGMDGVDKEKVQKIVYEMSKGSKFFVNEQRKDAYIKQKIESLRVQCAKLTENDIFHFQKIADRRISELEASRDLSQIWLHSDMDAFYAAVETLGNPQLKEMPLAVGSMSMICTANYEARKYGVRAAMPGFIARKLCPDLIFVPTNFEKYTYYSELTRKVFQKYDPCFIATSLDEAYINITKICLKRGVSGDKIAEELRSAIYEETGLTSSAGVAPNRLLAKVCSDINKPNGQYILPNDQKAVMAFIMSLPIRKIGGIGKVTENILKDVFGINNCEQMLQKSPLLCAMFSHSSADFFLSVSLGLGGTNTPQFRSRKSMSNERTFSATDKESLLFQNLEELAESLSDDMQKESLYGRTLTLKLKTATFEVRTRALSTTKYIQSKDDILNSAVKLLKAELPLSLRLMGLRMSQFQDNNRASLDTRQKTLTNYFCSGNSTAHSTTSEIHDDKVMVDSEYDGIFFSNDIFNSHIPYDDSNEPRETSMNSAEACTNQKKESSEKPNNLNETNEVQTSPLLMSDDTTTSTAPSKLKEQKELLVWVNDYICSICEIQLPPSFTRERQEHVDYHIAERLQNEEFKGGNSTHSICLDRSRESRKRRVEENPLKKRKSLSKNSNNYIPIDSFFVKTSKNN